MCATQGEANVTEQSEFVYDVILHKHKIFVLGDSAHFKMHVEYFANDVDFCKLFSTIAWYTKLCVIKCVFIGYQEPTCSLHDVILMLS